MHEAWNMEEEEQNCRRGDPISEYSDVRRGVKAGTEFTFGFLLFLSKTFLTS